jgi:hypothetical protein
MARKRIPGDVEEQLLLMCRRRCCVCFGLNRDISIKAGQIAHLDQNRDNNSPDNLAFMCFNHHDQYDSRTSQSKGLTEKEVRRFRGELYETIGRAWRQPIVIGSMSVPVRNGLSGRYICDGEFESAELQILDLGNSKIRVNGVALWGLKLEYGPHIGTLDFETELIGDTVVFARKVFESDPEYQLTLTFDGDRLIATETNVRYSGFGMNVSFAGEYIWVE